MPQQQQQEAYADQPLPGERFCPMEDELLWFFLKPMIESGPQQVYGLDNVVFDHDLYGDQEPWEIWDLYKNVRPHDLRLNKDLYFLTKLKKRKTRTKPSQRISRTVGRNGGTWKGNDYGKDVKIVETGVKIGTKKRFTYENKDSEQDGCWIMHEFSLDPSARDNKKAKKTENNDDYVLCLLRRNVEAKAKRGHKNERRIRRREEVEEEEEAVEVDGDACNGGDDESNNRNQEELHDEPQTKRQRNDVVTYACPQEVMMPSTSEYMYVDDELLRVPQQLGHDVTQQACPDPFESAFKVDHTNDEANGFDGKVLEESRQTMMMMPKQAQPACSDVDDEFAAKLEGLLDESSLPNLEEELAMIGFQDLHAAEDVGVEQQQSGHDVTQPPCPPLPLEAGGHRIINEASGFQGGAVDDIENDPIYQELLSMLTVDDEID